MEAGHDPSAARLAGAVDLFVSDDPERTWAELGDHLLYRQRSYARYMFEGTKLAANPPSFDGHSKDGFAVGTPEQIAEILGRRIDGLPVQHLFTWADYPGIGEDLIDRHIELVLTKVAPLLRARTAPADQTAGASRMRWDVMAAASGPSPGPCSPRRWSPPPSRPAGSGSAVTGRCASTPARGAPDGLMTS